MQLSKYIAHSGLCARRKAEILITDGLIKVNGITVTDISHPIEPTDIVIYAGKRLVTQKFVYIVLNKPDGFVTTLSDEQGRPTVTDLVKVPGNIRVYPVGRLDVTTTGVLLMTNDGDLAEKLAHPRLRIEKVYIVNLSRALQEFAEQQLRRGVLLNDGYAKPDKLDVLGDKRTIWRMSLHSGKNRIVRRMFTAVKGMVKRLDRVAFAGVTYKGLALGQWRMLSTKEIERLKKMTPMSPKKA